MFRGGVMASVYIQILKICFPALSFFSRKWDLTAIEAHLNMRYPLFWVIWEQSVIC